MSALVTCESCMKTQSILIAALKKLGVPEDSIQISTGDPLNLSGYSNQKAKVEVLIGKAFHQGYGDFGFAKGPDGTYKIYVDDLDDRGKLASKAGVSVFSSSLNQWYSALSAQKALKQQGLHVKIKQEDTKLVVVATG